jgi:hypothetical protein
MEYHERHEDAEPDLEHEGYYLDPSTMDVVEFCEKLCREAAEEAGYVQPDESLLQKLGDITLRQAAEGVWKGLTVAVSPRKSFSLLSEVSKIVRN